MARRTSRAREVPSWEPSPDLKEFASTLVERYHKHLQGQPIYYTWRSVSAKMKSGNAASHRLFTVGAAVIQNSGNPLWAGHQKVIYIEIPRKQWEQWSEDKREAVIDMALLRIQSTPKGGLKLIDLEFRDIITLWNRHGIFDEESKSIVKAAVELQGTLDLPPGIETLPDADAEDPIVTENVTETLVIPNAAAGETQVEIVEEAEDAFTQEDPLSEEAQAELEMMNSHPGGEPVKRHWPSRAERAARAAERQARLAAN